MAESFPGWKKLKLRAPQILAYGNEKRGVHIGVVEYGRHFFWKRSQGAPYTTYSVIVATNDSIPRLVRNFGNNFRQREAIALAKIYMRGHP
jgi:hypothetical protein